MPPAKGELIRAPLDPEPLTKLGDRVIHCAQSDTEHIWKALKSDWRLGRGLLPAKPGKWRGTREHDEGGVVHKELLAGYESCKSEKSREEYVWHCAERRARLPGGYYWVGRYILDYRYLYWPLHGRKFSYACESLPGTLNQVFLLCQRGIYKTVMMGYVTPICILGTRPWELIMISAATTGATEEILTRVRTNIDGNDKLMTLWPHLQPYIPRGTGKKDTWRADALMIKGYYDEKLTGGEPQPVRRESSLFGIAAEQSATRMHPTVFLFDDLINDTNSESQAWLEMVMRFFHEVMSNVCQGQVPMGGSGTCWTGNDLAARIRSGEIPDFKVIHLPIQKDGPWEPGGEYNLPKEEVDKQLSTVERGKMYTGFNDEVAKRIKDRCKSDYVWACQYECNPEASKATAFAIDDWKTFESEGAHTPWAYIGGDPQEAYARWVEAMFIFVVIDLATTTARTSNFTAIWVIGVDKKGRIWILDGVYDKMRPEFTFAALAQLYVAPREDEWDFWYPRPVWDGSAKVPWPWAAPAWRPDFVAIERGGCTESFLAGLGLREKEDDISINWEIVKIQGIGKTKGKRDRIEKAIGRTWARKLIRVRADIVKPSFYQPGGMINVTQKLRAEFVGFQDEANPDDGMDAISIGAEWFLFEGESLPALPQDEELAEKRRFHASVLGGIMRVPGEEERVALGLEEDGLVPEGEESIDFLERGLTYRPIKG